MFAQTIEGYEIKLAINIISFFIHAVHFPSHIHKPQA